MSLTVQLLLGTALFLAASLLQLAGLVRLSRITPTVDRLTLVATARLLIVIAAIHLGQIALWSLFLWAEVPELASFPDAYYFTLVTYTTVGYGDLTLDEGSRILGGMVAFAGILGFGMSTAFLVGLFAGLQPHR